MVLLRCSTSMSHRMQGMSGAVTADWRTSIRSLALLRGPSSSTYFPPFVFVFDLIKEVKHLF